MPKPVEGLRVWHKIVGHRDPVIFGDVSNVIQGNLYMGRKTHPRVAGFVFIEIKFMDSNFGKKITSAFSEILGALINTLFLMSFVSTIWLLVVGGWRLVVIGFIIAFIFTYLDTVLMLPAFGLNALGVFLGKKTFLISFLVFLISIIYQQLTIVAWSFFVVGYIVPFSNHYIIATLFGLSVVMAPLTYMAKNDNGLGTIISLIVAFISYIFFGLTYITATPIFIILVLPLLVATITIQGFAVYKSLEKTEASF